MHKSILSYFVILIINFCLSMNAYGDDASQNAENTVPKLAIQSLLIQVLKNHEEIQSVKSQVERAQAQYSQSKGLY